MRKRKCIEKKSYGTLFSAKEDTLHIWRKYKRKLSVYECPMCLDFHLTKGKTKIGCLLYRKINRIDDKPPLPVLSPAVKKKRKMNGVYHGRISTHNLIEHYYAQMRRMLEGKNPLSIKRYSSLKGVLPIAQQKLLLAALKNI